MAGDSRQAGELTDVVITPEMIEAGVRVLWESGKIEYESDSDRITVREILHASLSTLGAVGRGCTSDGLRHESAVEDSEAEQR